jgi:hypothetical protein
MKKGKKTNTFSFESSTSSNSQTPTKLESQFLQDSQIESPLEDSQVISRLKHTPPATEEIKWIKKTEPKLEENFTIKIEKKRKRKNTEEVKKKKKKIEPIEIIELSSQEPDIASPKSIKKKEIVNLSNSMKTPTSSTVEYFPNGQDSNVSSAKHTPKDHNSITMELFPTLTKSLSVESLEELYENSQNSSGPKEFDFEADLLRDSPARGTGDVDLLQKNSQSENFIPFESQKLTIDDEIELESLNPKKKKEKVNVNDLRAFYNLSEDDTEEVKKKKKKKKKSSKFTDEGNEENFQTVDKCALCLIDENKEPNDIQDYLIEKIGPLEYKTLSKMIYIHKNCALWSPEVYQNSKGEFRSLTKAVDRGRKTV